jgi:hypothetical protein
MIVAGMAKPGSVIGWKLDRGEREHLLQRFPPRYDEPVADHVTLETDAESKPLPPDARAEILGRADDGRGVEAMVVALDGSTDRPDGSTFHITWSLGPGRRAKESNDAIRDHGWTNFDEAVPVTIAPARF